jgi:hypothetical protein
VGLLFKNNAETTLSSGINNSVTTVPVTSAAVFPTPTANDVFFATIDDGSNVEVVKVTGISSNDLTVVRAQDNTSAATFGSGAKIELRLTAKVLEMGTSSLTDLDGDTQILVEEAADEDKIKFKAAGTEIARIDSTGLGIGGINPTKKFHVSIAGDASLFDRTGSAGGVMQFANGGTVKGNVGVQSGGFGLGGGFRDPDLFVATGGDVGIGKTNPTSKLDVNGTTTSNNYIVGVNGDIRSGGNGVTWSGETDFKIQHYNTKVYLQYAANGLFLRNNSGNDRMQLDASGNATFSGNVTAYGTPSDIRLKEDIEVIDNALEKVKQLKGITYTLKSDGNRLTGLVAQDLEKVLPEAVYTTNSIGDSVNEEPEEHLAIQYGNTVGLLVEAIKEQQEQIDTLNDYIKLQSASIMDMERRLNELEDK